MENQVPSVCAVIITFYPDLGNLRKLTESLSEQVGSIVIVDNGSPVSMDLFASGLNIENKPVVLSLGENLGIGHAQNVGIEYARTSGAAYVVLFDQDSCPEKDMVVKLLSAATELESSGVPLAAVAPSYKDFDGGRLSSFVRIGYFGFSRIDCAPGSRIVEADFLISSGSLIPLSAIAKIGGVDASLFIDHVDTEWCLRAKSKGFKLFGVNDAIMLHSLGDRRTRFWFLRWRTVPYHSPFRYYYMFRNSVLLQQRAYMPLRWKMADFARCLRALVFFGIFSSDRIACVKMMLRGARDGIAGVTGKMK
ncbi:glycosyltransferase family 2 protein [Pseudomonas sp. PDM09]|uniref:glycosyltransferase family 2 protein n=1 Tax=Pseudomonas sp. PDM09 TaxID=2769270 RepID=UPI001781DB91|nr:glycosyltransferase family 2 protein [Pseudomonas sp. PDM09]MBD9563420.1 glycosyltransferase family 2 protein [Pseudomonas sp. PDM09]